MSGFPFKLIPMSEELKVLIEKAKTHVMSKDEKDNQRKSWVIGNFMLDHPQITREYAENIYKQVVGE